MPMSLMKNGQTGAGNVAPLNTVGELASVLDLTESERKALEAKNLFRVDINPTLPHSLTRTIPTTHSPQSSHRS